MLPSAYWLSAYPLSHPQEQTHGARGSCFSNQRPQQGQCRVQACRCPQPGGLPWGSLTRSGLWHRTIQPPPRFWC